LGLEHSYALFAPAYDLLLVPDKFLRPGEAAPLRRATKR